MSLTNTFGCSMHLFSLSCSVCSPCSPLLLCLCGLVPTCHTEYLYIKSHVGIGQTSPAHKVIGPADRRDRCNFIPAVNDVCTCDIQGGSIGDHLEESTESLDRRWRKRWNPLDGWHWSLDLNRELVRFVALSFINHSTKQGPGG